MDKLVPLTGKDALDPVKREMQQRSVACAQEIDDVLKKHKCQLLASFTIMPPAPIQSNIKVMPIMEKKPENPQ